MPIKNSLTTLGLSQCQVLEKKLVACLSFLSWDFFCLENEFFFVQEVRFSQNPLINFGIGVAPYYMLIAHSGEITSFKATK